MKSDSNLKKPATETEKLAKMLTMLEKKAIILHLHYQKMREFKAKGIPMPETSKRNQTD